MSITKSASFSLNTLLLIYLVSATSPIYSCDLTNNVCTQAETLTLPNAELCFTACNDNGKTRELSPATQGCEASPFQTVWYRLAGPSYKSVLTTKLNSSALQFPLISIYHGTCNYLDLLSCNQGYNSSVAIQNLVIDPGTDIYIAISTSDGSVGEFELCLKLEEDPNVCNTNAALEIISTSDGSPTWGPYNPGEKVEACYTISGYENVSCLYLQGIVPIIGNGWDAISLDAEGQPKKITKSLITQGHTNFTTSNPTCEGDPAGEWRWLSSGSAQYNLNSANPLGLRNRDEVPAGWIFINSFDPSCWNFNDGCCTNPDENPNLGYGDDDYPLCGTGPTQSWTVCFELTAALAPTIDKHDCSIGMKTFSDGELGAIINNACNADMVSYTNASVKTCVPPAISISSNELELCKGDAFTIDLESDDPLTKFYWSLADEEELFMVADDNSLSHTFEETGTYNLEVYGSNGCNSPAKYLTVTVLGELEIELVQEPSIACPGEEVELKVLVDGVEHLENINFNWSHDAAQTQAVLVSSDDIVYEVAVNLGACLTTETITLNRSEFSTANFISTTDVCRGEMAELQLELQGQAPWSILMKDEAGEELRIETSSSDYTEQVLAQQARLFTLVSATDGNGCTMEAIGKWEIEVFSEMEVWAGDDKHIGCESEKIQLEGTLNLEMDKVQVQWMDASNSIIEDATSMFPLISEPGLYTLLVTDLESGCTGTDEVEVKEIENAINLELSNPQEIEIALGESIFLEAHVDIAENQVAEVLWLHDGTIECETCMSSMAYPTSDVSYNIAVVDIFGCMDTKTIQVTIREDQNFSSKLYLPNTFDPGSLDNKLFKAYGDIALIKDFMVSDRWGKELFSVHDIGPDSELAAWDGIVAGQPVNSGVYVYFFEATLLDGSSEQRVGTITIIR